ncbi:unnamed protein product [Effrenium voratum]|nr:unnamed protein product [Effrenium voratum]
MDTISTMHSSRESPAQSPNLRPFTQPALTAQSPASTVQFPSLLAGQKPMEKPVMYAGMPPSRMVSMPGAMPGATPGAVPGAMLRPFGYQPTPFPDAMKPMGQSFLGSASAVPLQRMGMMPPNRMPMAEPVAIPPSMRKPVVRSLGDVSESTGRARGFARCEVRVPSLDRLPKAKRSASWVAALDIGERSSTVRPGVFRLSVQNAPRFHSTNAFKAMRPATARGNPRASSPQKDPELMAKLRDLETQQKNEERAKKLAERKRTQELREAKKKLSRELQQAQRGLTKSEQEVNKLTGQLSRTEQQAQQATVKKNREGEKMEEGIGRIRQKHGKVNTVLRDKMANVGQARGRLAHVQFALSMLEKAGLRDGHVPRRILRHTNCAPTRISW